MKTKSNFIRNIIVGTALLIGIYFAAAFVMIFWKEPKFTTAPEISLESLEKSGKFEQVYKAEERRFTMRDEAELFSQQLVEDSNITIVFIHGILSSSFLHNKSSGMLRKAGAAEVIAIDLRGHGQSSGKPGDIGYIGQYEDDIADVIAEIRANKPDVKVILAGHSMGGGIALRYAMKDEMPSVDGYLLFAPHLGSNSPTLRKEMTEETAKVMKIHIPRIIGLILLNTFGIESFNDLNTLFFNFPPEFPISEYSFRAMASMMPEDYKIALEAVDKPLLVVIGSNDEAFLTEHFELAIREYSNGEVKIIVGENHDGLLHNEETMAVVSAWIAKL